MLCDIFTWGIFLFLLTASMRSWPMHKSTRYMYTCACKKPEYANTGVLYNNRGIYIYIRYSSSHAIGKQSFNVFRFSSEILQIFWERLVWGCAYCIVEHITRAESLCLSVILYIIHVAFETVHYHVIYIFTWPVVMSTAKVYSRACVRVTMATDEI